MAKRKTASVKMPSKAQMARDEIRWRAERLVRDAMESSPSFKQAVRKAESELAKAEKKVKKVLNA